MQQLLELYALFAITTALVAQFELFIPVVYGIAHQYPELDVIKVKWVTLLTLGIMAVILAPVVFPACIFPSIGNKFRAALEQGLLSRE